MVITWEKDKGAKYKHYCLDGKRISSNAFMASLRKYLNNTGVMAVLKKVMDEGKCTLDLDIPDENKILTEKIMELQDVHEKSAALEKHLGRALIKAAKYDGLIGVRKA